MIGTLTARQRQLRARAAAFALHSQGGTNTRAATAKFLERFEQQVDPTGALEPAERARRAAYARKSYMTGLALKASRAKSRQQATLTAAEVRAALDFTAQEETAQGVSETSPQAVMTGGTRDAAPSA